MEDVEYTIRCADDLSFLGYVRFKTAEELKQFERKNPDKILTTDEELEEIDFMDLLDD